MIDFICFFDGYVFVIGWLGWWGLESLEYF